MAMRAAARGIRPPLLIDLGRKRLGAVMPKVAAV
jgi:hypothetical protein